MADEQQLGTHVFDTAFAKAMPLHPLVASVLLGQSEMASQAASRRTAEEQADIQKKTTHTVTTNADGTVNYSVKNASPVDATEATAEAAAKPKQDVYSVLQERGIDTPRPHNPQDEASLNTFGGRFAQAGNPLAGLITGIFGGRKTFKKSLSDELAQKRVLQAEGLYEKILPSVREERQHQIETRQETRVDEQGAKQRSDLLNQILDQAVLPQLGSEQDALDQVTQRLGGRLNPGEAGMIRAQYRKDARKAALEDQKTVAGHINGLKVEDISGYDPKSFSQFQSDHEAQLGRPLNPGEASSLRARFNGLQRDKAVQERNEKLKIEGAARAATRLSVTIANQPGGARSEELNKKLDTLIEAENNGADLKGLGVDAKTHGNMVQRRAERLQAGDATADFPVALNAKAQDGLAKLSGLRAETESLRNKIAEAKKAVDPRYWNMPFEQLPQAIRYKLGMGSQDELGKLQSAFSIERYSGTLALIPGIRRGDLIQKVAEHLPVFGKDSMQLMDDKLKNADDFYAQNQSALTKFGTKSGVVHEPAGGASPGAKAPAGRVVTDPNEVLGIFGKKGGKH